MTSRIERVKLVTATFGSLACVLFGCGYAYWALWAGRPAVGANLGGSFSIIVVLIGGLTLGLVVHGWIESLHPSSPHRKQVIERAFIGGTAAFGPPLLAVWVYLSATLGLGG